MSSERGVLVSGNWKMNENHFEALKLVSELSVLLRSTALPSGREVSLHPSFTSLRTVQTLIETDRIPVSLGAQNCHHEDAGAYTGEVSAPMLSKLGVHYVLAGHSERRQYAGESDEVVAKKLDAILRHQMSPILCVGEGAESRSEGSQYDVVAAQLAAVLTGTRRAAISRFVIAYEPIWAIGTGLTATPEDAGAMCSFIHEEIERLCGSAASTVRVQYGGSVTEANAAELLAEKSVDGLLVGGASLDASRFGAICFAPG